LWGGGDEENGGGGIGVEGVGKGDLGGLETFDVDNMGFCGEEEVDWGAFAVIGTGEKVFLGGWDGLLFTDCIDEGAGGYEDLRGNCEIGVGVRNWMGRRTCSSLSW